MYPTYNTKLAASLPELHEVANIDVILVLLFKRFRIPFLKFCRLWYNTSDLLQMVYLGELADFWGVHSPAQFT
jgi:hypothetical protein